MTVLHCQLSSLGNTAPNINSESLKICFWELLTSSAPKMDLTVDTPWFKGGGGPSRNMKSLPNDFHLTFFNMDPCTFCTCAYCSGFWPTSYDQDTGRKSYVLLYFICPSFCLKGFSFLEKYHFLEPVFLNTSRMKEVICHVTVPNMAFCFIWRLLGMTNWKF